MLSKRLGRQTVRLGEPVSVVSFANIGGKQEAQGPLAGYFDELNQDPYFGQKSWEKGESAMQQFALQKAMEKGGLGAEDLRIRFIDNDGTEQILTCTYNAKTGELIFEVSSTGSFTIEQA